MTIYLTSDPHLGHRLVSQIRGFGSTVEHDLEFVKAWKQTVNENDHVWFLGDLSVSHPENALELLRDLPGVKHLVAGNHDEVHPMHRQAWKWQRAYLEVFASVQSAARMRVRRNKRSVDVLLSHFPYAGDHSETDRHNQWRLRDEGAWLVHGHTHSAEKRQFDRCLHVGWDAHHALVPWKYVEDIVVAESPEVFNQ